MKSSDVSSSSSHKVFLPSVVTYYLHKVVYGEKSISSISWVHDCAIIVYIYMWFVNVDLFENLKRYLWKYLFLLMSILSREMRNYTWYWAHLLKPLYHAFPLEYIAIYKLQNDRFCCFLWWINSQKILNKVYCCW